MEKAGACSQMVSSKTAQELEIRRYRISFCHFPLMFHIAERLLYFDIFEVIFINLIITLCLPAAFLVNFLFSL